MVEKAAEGVEACDDELVVGGLWTRGRSWEGGWEAGCGMGTDGDQLMMMLAGIRNPPVGDTSEQSKVGKVNASAIYHTC